MKTFKVNLVAVFALLIGITTMSFQLSNTTTTEKWYAVGPDLGSGQPILGEVEPDPEVCLEDYEFNNICAIKFNLGTNPMPDYVHEVTWQHTLAREVDPNLK